MIVLHQSFQKDKDITRLTFLSTLIDEAFDYLHTTLCASAVRRKLFLLPFNRQVKVTGDGVRAMEGTLRYCQDANGVLIVAPEHRLSLQLKRYEVQENSDHVGTTLDVIAEMPFRDLLDESDEVLHHRFQLIYAIGLRTGLPAGPQRWRAVQSLLRVIKCGKHDELKAMLEDERICSRSTSNAGNHPEAFGTLRLLRGDPLKQAMPAILRHLFDALMEEIPYDLRWMSTSSNKKELHRVISDPAVAFDTLSFSSGLPEAWRNDLLALRGFIAGGILEHCLVKRHRVDYGIARPGQKRLAVPFRAADTAAVRSEFAHPDCALLFTHLAYYSDGLNESEFRDALLKLMSLGPTAQRAFYQKWFAHSKLRMSADDLGALDDVNKIDPTNPQQLHLLWEYYRLNFETINFWLDTCVLPTETQQHPQRLVTSAWHLMNNGGHVVGFSGTNDNRRLLPLHVSQNLLADQTGAIARELRATNGKMLDLIRRKTQDEIEVLPSSHEKPLWKATLERAIELKVDVLIDSGGLMAGQSNKFAAQWVLRRLPETFRGVVFFSVKKRQWIVLDRENRCLPRDRSPIQEIDCFAYFDESRCRGADLKLGVHAVAMLTLGVGSCKDKIMQAAGRMRRLDRGHQRLIFAAPHEVVNQLKQAREGPRLNDVLDWVMTNTVEATARGLTEWANQGTHFATTADEPDRAFLDEMLALDDLYSNAMIEKPVPSIVKSIQERYLRRCAGACPPRPESMELLRTVRERVALYGREFKATSTRLDEECERELELEIEEEQEIEREFPSVEPRREVDWDFSQLLSATQPTDLPTDVITVSDMVSTYLTPSDLRLVDWPANIFCTVNFALTILPDFASSKYDDYLRPLDSLLVFPGGEVLLISEREANAVVRLMWANSSIAIRFLHTAYARESFDHPESPTFVLQLPQNPGRLRQSPRLLRQSPRLLRPAASSLDESTFTALQLFNGETAYKTENRMRFLYELIDKNTAGGGPPELVRMRGFGQYLAYSDLELACERSLRSAGYAYRPPDEDN
jgi:hypothetical protein